ncbi:hypothetical protein [Thauera humireducens]|uniref:hypothetical protein n=1 Tax=Thauera humireducens TaxID=1134435 RepID=UPI00311D5C94
MVLAGVMLPATAVQANDFPTLDRVLWVHECMREHPDGGHYEMVSKCSCALDRIAGQMSHEQYMAMKTSSDARSIGGERGGYIRANKQEQKSCARIRRNPEGRHEGVLHQGRLAMTSR